MAAQSSGNPTGTKWDYSHKFVVAEFSTGRKVSVHFNEDHVFDVAPDGQAKRTEVQRLIRHYRESGTVKQQLALEQVDAMTHLDRRNVDVMRMIVNFIGSVEADQDHAAIGSLLVKGETRTTGEDGGDGETETETETETGGETGTEDGTTEDGETETGTETEAVATETETGTGGDEPTLEEMIRRIAREESGVSMSDLEAALAGAIESVPAKRLEIASREIKPTKTVNTDELHKDFNEVVKAVSMSSELGVYLVGPAGTGKTFLAGQVATALDLDLHEISMGSAQTTAAFFGFISPVTSDYTTTAYREWYQNGGVLLLDEMDASHPGMLVALNKTLSDKPGTGSHKFPDGRVVKHEDCLVVSTANTFGNGPDRQYVGRNALDAATLSRFAWTCEITPDVELERAMGVAECLAYGGTESDGMRAAAVVEQARQLALDTRTPAVIGQRDVMMIARWIADANGDVEALKHACRSTFCARLNEQQLSTSGISELVDGLV